MRALFTALTAIGSLTDCDDPLSLSLVSDSGQCPVLNARSTIVVHTRSTKSGYSKLVEAQVHVIELLGPAQGYFEQYVAIAIQSRTYRDRSVNISHRVQVPNIRGL